MAAQLSHYCKKDLPEFDNLIEKGEFTPIREWLTEKVHKHGKRYASLDDLLVAEVGEKLNSKYFIDYLTEKYSDLYKI
jgi:carboxypeptidase Taq